MTLKCSWCSILLLIPLVWFQSGCRPVKGVVDKAFPLNDSEAIGISSQVLVRSGYIPNFPLWQRSNEQGLVYFMKHPERERGYVIWHVQGVQSNPSGYSVYLEAKPEGLVYRITRCE